MILDNGPMEETNGRFMMASTCLYELDCGYPGQYLVRQS